VYPNNEPIINQGASAVPPGLFAGNVVGRVSPVGNFTGFADSIEYFFGLAPSPKGNPAGIAFHRADITSFSSQCASVASSVVSLRSSKVDVRNGAVIPSILDTTLKQVAFWRFNEKGEVMQYDAWIPNLAAWTKAANGVNFDNAFIQTATAAALCPTIQQRCTGRNSQFSNLLSCVYYLESKPFGSFDEVRLCSDSTISVRAREDDVLTVAGTSRLGETILLAGPFTFFSHSSGLR